MKEKFIEALKRLREINKQKPRRFNQSVDLINSRWKKGKRNNRKDEKSHKDKNKRTKY